MKAMRNVILPALAGMLIIFGVGIGSTASAQKRSKKPKAVKPAYITSPPVRVKSHIRNGKVVKAHDRQRKPKT